MKRKLLIFSLVMLFVLGIGIFNPTAAEIEVNLDDQSGDLVKVLNDIYIPADKTVQGDVVAILGDIKVDGQVTGDVVAILGDIEINNSVDGEAVAVLGSISRKDQGTIGGGIIEVGPGQMARNIEFNHPFIGFFGWGFRLVKLLLTYGLAVLVLALIPEQERQMAAAFRQDNLRKGALGLAALILWPIVTVVSAISIIGLPLVPVIILSFFLIKFIGYVALVLFIGGRIKRIGDLEFNVFLELLVGLVVFSLLGAVPIVGAISYLVIAVFSLGVIIDTKFGTGKPWFAAEKLQELPQPPDDEKQE